MAKKNGDENFDDFDLDDFGFDDPSGGGDDGMPSMKDDRKAITKVASSFASGAKDYLLSPRRQREFIENSLPPGYSSGFETLATTTGFASELYDTASAELKPLKDGAKKLLDTALPKEGQYKPGGLVEKLAKWSRSDKESARLSQDQMDEASVQSGLADIFKAQAEDQAKKDATANAERTVDRAINMKLQGGSLQQLRQLTNLVGRQVAYQDQVLIKFQQKQLELNYRQYFVQRQLLTAFKDHASMAKANLEVISKNTGLPDFVKMRNKEVIEQVMKTSTIAALTGGARQWFKNGTQRLLSHYKTQLREFGSTVGMAMEFVQSGVETSNQNAEMGISRGDMALEMGGAGLGEYAAGKLAGKLTPKLKELAEKNPKAVAWGLRLANMNKMLPQTILDWVRDKSGADDDSFWGRFLNSTKQGIGDFKKDKAVRLSAADKLDEAVHFNLQARQTLVEVIPGWLARIHNEQRMMRTGNDKLQPLKYSFESGTFEETRTAYKNVVKKVFNGKQMKESAKKLTEAMGAFEGADLTVEEKAALAKYMMERADEKDVGFSKKNFFADDGFEGMDAGLATSIKYKLRSFTGASIHDRMDSNGNVKRDLKFDMSDGAGQARLSAMIRGFEELQNSLPNFTEILQKEMAKGNQDALMDLGLVEYDSETMTWNAKVDYFREAVMDRFSRLTPEQQSKHGVWDKVIRDVMNKLQSAVDGKRAPQTHFATGGHVRGPKLRAKFPNKRGDINFRRTGLIQGPGTGTSDSIDAKLSTDEFVIRAETTREPGALGFLKDFNKRGMSALSGWAGKLRGQSDFVGPQLPFHMRMSNAGNGLMGKMKGWGGKASTAFNNARAAAYDDMPDDGRNMGPVAPGGIKKRTVTDIYELLDHWAPLWSAGISIPGGLHSLSRVGGKLKGFMGRVMPGKLKAMAEAFDKDELKRQAGQGLSWMEKRLMGLKDRVMNFGGDKMAWARNGLGKLFEGGKWAKGKIGAGLKRLKDGFPGAVKGAWDFGNKLWNDHQAQFKDIYVKGEDEPAMTAERMQAGDYTDRLTGKVIKRLSDITGPVDETHSKKVVIGKERFKKGLYDKHGKPLPIRILNRIKKMGAPLTKAFNFAKGLGTGIFRRLDAWEDVYVKGEEEPRLYARLLAEGKYFDKKTRKPIYHVKDITGPVVDETGAVVLNGRDLKKGLVNQQGKPITTLSQRLKSAAMGAFDKVLGLGTRAAGFVWEQAGKVGNMLMKLGSKAKGLPGKLKGMNFNLGFGFMMNRPVVDKLEEIRLILDERMKKPKRKASNDSDGDGSRDGSVAEQKEEKAAEEAKKQQGRMATLLEKLTGMKDKAKDKAKSAGGGIMDMFSSLKGLMGSVTSMFTGFTKFLPGATTMMTVISKIKNIPGLLTGAATGAANIGSKVLTGAKNMLGGGGIIRNGLSILGRGALAAGRFALGGAGTAIRGAMMLGSAVLSAPVLLAAGVVVGAYAAYKLYKYVTKEDDYLMRWRMAQYGVDPDDDKLVQKILNVEGLLLKNIQAPKGQPARFGSGVKFKQLMDIFEVKEEAQEHLDRFLGWFRYRFKPVFLSAVSIFRDITVDKTNILNADQVLTCDQAKDMVKKTHFPAGSPQSPYAWNGLPFKDEDEAEYNEEDIEDLMEDTIDDIEDDRKRYDKNSQINKKLDDSVLKAARDEKQKKKEDTLWNRTKNGASNLWDKTKKGAKDLWEGAKSGIGDALDKVKEWGKAGMDLAGNALKKAGSMAGDAWKWMKNTGSNVVAGAGSAVTGAVELAKRVGSAVIPKTFSANASQVMGSLMSAAKAAGIASNPAALAMFLAQMYHESGGFRTMQENLNYKADTMMKLFSRAKNAGRAAVEQVAKAGPVAVAEFLYGGRMGNDQPGDGWKFRGRGPTQLTGKDNYKAASKALGIDLVSNPDLVADPDVGAKVATWYWTARVGSKGANGDVVAATKAINGGTNGLSERGEAYKEFKARIDAGTLSPDMMGPASKAEGKPVTPAPSVKATAPAASTTTSGGSTPVVTAPPPASATDSTIAKHKEAQVATGAATATTTKAAATATTSTDSVIQKSMDELLKVNRDQLAVLQSIDGKLDRFVSEGPATPDSKPSGAALQPGSRKTATPPMKMGAR